MTAPREHRWGNPFAGVALCQRRDCTAQLRVGNPSSWRMDSRTRWRKRSTAHPIPPCTGKEETGANEESDHQPAPRPPLNLAEWKDQTPEEVWKALHAKDAEIATLKAELARLKPTGQVAEDEGTLREALRCNVQDPGMWPTCAALSRLAAKAQGYEAIREMLADNYGTDGDPLERVKDLLESEERACSEARVEQAERHRAENERDAAVADNAALLGTIRKLVKGDMGQGVVEAHSALHGKGPHPGAALLKEHQEAGLRAVQAAYDTVFTVWGDAVRAKQVADAVAAAVEAKP